MLPLESGVGAPFIEPPSEAPVKEWIVAKDHPVETKAILKIVP